MSGLPTACQAISRNCKAKVYSMSYAENVLLICKIDLFVIFFLSGFQSHKKVGHPKAMPRFGKFRNSEYKLVLHLCETRSGTLTVWNRILMVHFNHFYYQYRYVRCVHCRLLNPNGYVGRIFKRLTSLNSSHQGEKLHFAAILVVKIGKVKTVAVHEQGHKLHFLSELSITDLFPSTASVLRTKPF